MSTLGRGGGSPGGTIVTGVKVAISSSFSFENGAGSRPKLMVENSDGDPINLTFTRIGKFANGDTMGVRSATVAAGAPIESVVFEDFPQSEFGTLVDVTADNTADATVLLLL